jgi:hypothetical protein
MARTRSSGRSGGRRGGRAGPGTRSRGGTRTARRGGTRPGSRTRRGYVANTRAARSAYAVAPSSPVGGRGRAKYPIDTPGRARNALARVSRFGTPAEKRAVHAKVRSRYPAIARRSSVVPTRGGPGRRYGEPAGTRHRSGGRGRGR